MRQFQDKLQNIYKLVLEQDAPVAGVNLPPPEDSSMTAGNATMPAAPDGNDISANESDTDKLTPEGEVLLIRLIKKALTVKVKTEDLTEITGLGEINEKNAKDMLKKLIEVIRRYSDVDINV
jgi:hypothetical protein